MSASSGRPASDPRLEPLPELLRAIADALRVVADSPGLILPADLVDDLADSGTLLHSSSAHLVIGERTVVKIHGIRHTDVDPALLASRLRLAAATPAVFVRPLQVAPLRLQLPGSQRWASLWPRVRPLAAADPREVPWADLARTLATLHTEPLIDLGQVPVQAGPARLERVARQLHNLPEVPHWLSALADRHLREVRRAPAPASALVHGDLHLGQVALTADGVRLFDVDDLGRGGPAWDLGRFAAGWASGQLPDESWDEFVAAYRAAGGPGVPASGDPWPRLDLAARCSLIVATCGLLRDRHELDAPNRALLQRLLEACARVAEA